MSLINKLKRNDMFMKKVLIALCCMGAMLTVVSSCDSKGRLAEAVEGEWTGNPERLLDTGAASATMVRMMEFSPGEVATEGTITMTAVITVENTMQFNESVVTPLTITATGTATITGTYQVRDHDDILVGLDATSLSVSVDPDAVQLNYNIISEDSAPMVEKLKPRAAVLATQQINRAAQNAFANITEIEDIHIKNNTMRCEIGDRDIAFSRAGSK